MAELNTISDHSGGNGLVEQKVESNVDEQMRDPASSRRIGEAQDYPGALKLSLILAALFMTTFLAALDLGIVATAIPSITNEFKALDEIGWYGGVYFLTIGVFSSFWGILYKYFNPRNVFLTTTAIFLLGSLIAATAPNSIALIVGRAIAGWGGAGIVGGSYVISHHVARPERRPAITGLIGAVFIFSSILGPIVGGAFTDRVSWRWCFYVNLPIGGVALILVFLLVRLPDHSTPQQTSISNVFLNLDFPGLVLIIASLICLTLALQWGGTARPWSHGSVIACLVVWVLLTVAFVLAQVWQGEHATIPLHIITKRVVWTNCLYVFIINGPNFLVIYYLPIYFQAIKGQTSIQSGVNILPAVCFFALGCLTSGWFIGKIGHWQPFLAAGALLSVVGSALIYSLEVDTSPAWYLGSQIIFGFGAGGSSQVPMIAIQAFTNAKDVSRATGVVLFFQLVNGCYFISAGQAIFANRLLATLSNSAIDVDPNLVLNTGVGDIRHVVNEKILSEVLEAYMVGLKAAFALGLAAAALCVPVGLLAPREKLPVNKDRDEGSAFL